MVTIENALALFGLVLVTAFGAFAISVGVTQVRCVDAARDTARAAARGETDAVSRQAGERSAPAGARIDISHSGDTVHVQVRASVRAPGLLSRVGTIDLSAGSTVDAEPGSAVGRAAGPTGAVGGDDIGGGA
ncbi:MAG TPA: TadE family type IV pilus minor pilin [Actinopolymorphaceae bacterium]|jgi:hypothetical protein